MRRHRTEYKSQLTATSRPPGSSDSATERPSAGALSYHITSHRQHDERALCQGRTTVMQCRIKQRVIYSTRRRRLAIFRRFSRYIFYHQTVVQRLLVFDDVKMSQKLEGHHPLSETILQNWGNYLVLLLSSYGSGTQTTSRRPTAAVHALPIPSPQQRKRQLYGIQFITTVVTAC